MSSPCSRILRPDAAVLRYNMLLKQVIGRLPITSGTETLSARWPSYIAQCVCVCASVQNYVLE